MKKHHHMGGAVSTETKKEAKKRAITGEEEKASLIAPIDLKDGKYNGLPLSFKSTYSSVLGELTSAERNRFIIAVGGKLKMGKSTLINALIGYPVLPSSVTPETRVVVIIQHDLTANVPTLTKVRPKINRGVNRNYVTFEDDCSVVRIGFPEIQKFIAEKNAKAIEDKNNPVAGNQFDAYCIKCQVHGFGKEEICIFDTPGLGEENFQEQASNYYNALFYSADLWIEVVDFNRPPSDAEMGIALKGLAYQMFSSGRTFENTSLLVSKCDVPTTERAKRGIEAWGKGLQEIFAKHAPINPKKDVIFLSALHLLKFTYFKGYRKLIEEEEEEILSIADFGEKERATARKVKIWEASGNPTKVMELIQSKHACMESKEKRFSVNKQEILEMTQDAISALESSDATKAIADDALMQDLVKNRIHVPLESLKEKIKEISESSTKDLKIISILVNKAIEDLKILITAFKEMEAKAKLELFYKKYYVMPWQMCLNLMHNLDRSFLNIEKATSDAGFFGWLFSMKGAMLAVNLTYGMRLLGYWASTWWCVPIFASLVVVDAIVTFIFYRRHSADDKKEVDAQKQWNQYINTLGKEFDGLEENILRPSKDILSLASLGTPQKAQNLTLLRDLKVHLEHIN